MLVLAQSVLKYLAAPTQGGRWLLVSWALTLGVAWAQNNEAVAPAAPVALPISPLPLVVPTPAWTELSAEQQSALAPLAPYWSQLSPQRKRKWLALSSHFNQLPEEDKAKLHDRMTDWVQLSAQQRNQARLNFNAAPKLSNDEKLARWQAYQSLSEEDREKFKNRAPKHPLGAATVIKPNRARKPTHPLDTNHTQPPSQPPLIRIRGTAKIDVSPLQLNSHTLLPRTKPL